jgi:GxxExxY protein
MKLEHEEITEKIIGSAFEVHRMLGCGFLEKVYQRAMQVELEQRGLQAKLEEPIKVCFKGCVVGEYFADLLVEKKVIVELKVSKEYNPADEAQLLNELKGTGISVGLLINFGRENVEFKRMVFSDPSAFDPRISAAKRPNGTARK